MFSPNKRAKISVLAPAGNGTTALTVRPGCDDASMLSRNKQQTASTPTPADKCRYLRRGSFTASPQLFAKRSKRALTRNLRAPMGPKPPMEKRPIDTPRSAAQLLGYLRLRVLWKGVRMSGCVQVFGRRNDGPDHAL